MTGDPRIYSLYELVQQADRLRADEIRLEASPRGVRKVYLRTGRVIDVSRIPAEFFRKDAPGAYQSPLDYLAQYELAFHLCLMYEEELTGLQGSVVHIRANSPLNHVPACIPGFTGPPCPTRSVQVTASVTESVVAFFLRYKDEVLMGAASERGDKQQGDEAPAVAVTTQSVPQAETVPCPFCGKPLRTPLAKQCRSCRMDWHDPDHVFCRARAGLDHRATTSRTASDSTIADIDIRDERSEQ